MRPALQNRRAKRLVAMVTIAAIVGTLWGCGRYGSPKRPAAPAAQTLAPLEATNPN